MGAKRPGSKGETTRLNFRGETTRWKWFGGQTSCYHNNHTLYLLFHVLISFYTVKGIIAEKSLSIVIMHISNSLMYLLLQFKKINKFIEK